MSRRAVLLLLAVWLPSVLILSPAQARTAPPFRVYLTFEDGPTDAYTPEILDLLAAYDAKATFFVNGWQIAGHEALLQRIIVEGHALGNHLWSEPGLYAGAADEEVLASYARTEEALRAALGPALPLYDAQVKLFRQPGGGAKPLPAADGVQVITYNWHVDADDCGWRLDPASGLSIDAQVTDNLIGTPRSLDHLYNIYDYGDGTIVVLHDINRVTARILPTVLSELSAAGATFPALPRPGDSVGTMPAVLGVPPVLGAGLPGATMPARLRDYAWIRTSPDETAPLLVASLPPDTELTALGRWDAWFQVEYQGQTGWIFGGNVRVLGPIPSLPVSAP